MKLKKTKLPKKYKHFLIGILIVIVYYWALSGTDTSLSSFAKGFPFMVDFIKRMFPPAISNLNVYILKAIETVNPEVIKAIVSTGANKIQTIVRGIFPEVKPLFVNYSLYYLENNFRAATVLGLVGAGGIGMELITSMRLFKSREVLTILIVMILTVTMIDRFSAYLRKKIVNIEVVE